MEQLANLWRSLSPGRRAVVVAAAVAAFAAVLALGRMAAAPSLSLLYAGLETGPAGEVVRALEQRGVAYEVRGGAIFVESARRDALRMTLASEGLPANSAKGYELLDDLSGFGTTSQMFDAAYWRAKEGELARTIMSSPHVAAARVHVATAGSNPFQRDLRPTASISVTSANGTLPAAQARALRFLVASAVPGMAPDDVAVVDSRGGLIDGTQEGRTTPDSEDRAEALRQKVQRLIEARMGYGNAVVEVTVEPETERESIRERRFDPEQRVAISTDTSESSAQASDSGGDEVTVASNLPDGDAGGAGGTSSSQETETRERVNYEVSETEREILRSPGAVKRLTVAVLVNGTTREGADGSTEFVPVPEDQLSDLRDLVASAVGFDEARGDAITIRSMPFELIPPEGEAAAPSLFHQLGLDVMSLIQLAVLALVALGLGLFVIRPILAAGRSETLALPAGPEGAPQDATEGSVDGDSLEDFTLPALTGEIDDGPFDFGDGAGGLPDLSSRDPVERLREMIGERKEETVEILRSWLEESEEKAS